VAGQRGNSDNHGASLMASEHEEIARFIAQVNEIQAANVTILHSARLLILQLLNERDTARAEVARLSADEKA
jgi:hypothetical protein